MRLSISKQTFGFRFTSAALLAFALTPFSGLGAQNAQPPPTAGADDIVELETLNVTGLRERGFVPKNSAAGTKTIIPLLEAPQSISVITADQMAAQGVRGLDDAVKYSSGVIGNPYGFDPRTDWLYVRGSEPTRYIDGLIMPDGTWTGVTRWDPYGFERVEVLKGASSALYGIMPVGGLINASSKRPTLDAFGELSVSVGSFDQLQAALDVGGPLLSDANGNKTLLYRVTGVARAGDTVLDYSRDDRQFIAPAFTWLINADTYITFLARYQRDMSRGLLGFLPTQGTIDPNPNGAIPISRYTGEPDFDSYEKELWTLGYEIEHRLNKAWRIRQNLRVVGASVDHSLVGGLGLQADFRTLSRYTWTPHEKSNGVAVDTQGIGKFVTGALSHEVLFGVDYNYGRNDRASGIDYGAPALDIFNPRYGSPIARPADSDHIIQKQSQFGIYAQDRIKWEKFILTLGARQDFVSLKTDDLFKNTHQTRDDHELSGRAAIGYLFDNGLAPYAAWSTSFKPNRGTTYSGHSFAPTTGELTEAGLKYQPRNIDALFTVSAYQSMLKNVLTTDTSLPPGVFGFQVQQGKIRVRGVEAEARATPVKGLSLVAAYTYTDSEVRETSVPGELGRQLMRIPKNRFALWADYTFQKGILRNFGLGGGVTYNSAVYGDPTNLFKGDSSTLWDMTAHYDFRNWRFQVNASNLFDKRYVSIVDSGFWAYYGNPRVVTASVTYKF